MLNTPNPGKIFQTAAYIMVIALVIAVVILWLSFTEINRTVNDLAFQSPIPVNSKVSELEEKPGVTQNSILGADSEISQATAQSLTNLEASISALLIKVAKLEKEVVKLKETPSSGTTSSSTTSTQDSDFKKETMYLGSTSTTSRDWTESGLEIGINSSSYPEGVQAKIEAGMSIIGGEAWVRLKNKSTGAIIPASEISHNNNTNTWKTSTSFDLHEGGHTYVLEIRSTSGETANVSGARVIIE